MLMLTPHSEYWDPASSGERDINRIKPANKGDLHPPDRAPGSRGFLSRLVPYSQAAVVRTCEKFPETHALVCEYFLSAQNEALPSWSRGGNRVATGQTAAQRCARGNPAAMADWLPVWDQGKLTVVNSMRETHIPVNYWQRRLCLSKR